MDFNHSEIPIAVKSSFSILSPLLPIRLHEGRCEILQAESWHDGIVSVNLCWEGEPVIRIEWTALKRVYGVQSFPTEIRIGEDRYHLTGMQWKEGNYLTSTLPFFKTPKSTQNCQEIISHICLLPFTGGEAIQDGKRFFRGRLSLCKGPWKIELDDNPVGEHNFENFLEANVFTHLARLSRSDNVIFDFEEGLKFIEGFHYFLSFSRFGYTMPVLLGFRESDEGKWNYQASAGICRKLSQPCGWLTGLLKSREPKGYLPSINYAFSQFIDCWLNPETQDLMRVAISWYCSSASGALESRILMIASALECVHYHAGFGKRDLAANIDDYFSSKGIAMAWTEDLRSLSKVRRGKTGEELTVYRAFAEVRNKCAHGKSNELQIGDAGRREVLLEAWLWGVEAFEVSLLAMIGYHGHYDRATGVFSQDSIGNINELGPS